MRLADFVFAASVSLGLSLLVCGQLAMAATQVANVRCVDSNGAPVGGVEVHLLAKTVDEPDAKYAHIGPATSDANGIATFRSEASGSDFDRRFYARVPGKYVGTTRHFANRFRADQGEIIVKLLPSRSIEGVVTVPENVDPNSVNIAIRTMHIKSGNGPWDFQIFTRDKRTGLDQHLKKFFCTRADAGGRFTLSDVPIEGHLYLIATGQGLGEGQYRNPWDSWSFDEPISIDLELERRISGIVASPAGEPLANIVIQARFSNSEENVAYHSTFESVTDSQGHYELVGLPNRRLVLTADDADGHWGFRPLEEIVGAEDGRDDFDLRMETAVTVSGTVRTNDGRPLANASVVAIGDTNNRPLLAEFETDENGNYQLHLPGGVAKVLVHSAPSSHQAMSFKEAKLLLIETGQDPIKNVDFVLKPQR